MREIKFRGWNASSKQMVDNVMSLTKATHLGSKHYSPSMGMVACDEVMQFTGLFDKNGVGVYEGDICLAEDEKTKYQIIWHSAGFVGWMEDELIKILNLRNGLGEVIGNIYEHKYLLDNK